MLKETERYLVGRIKELEEKLNNASYYNRDVEMYRNRLQEANDKIKELENTEPDDFYNRVIGLIRCFQISIDGMKWDDTTENLVKYVELLQNNGKEE